MAGLDDDERAAMHAARTPMTETEATLHANPELVEQLQRAVTDRESRGVRRGRPQRHPE